MKLKKYIEGSQIMVFGLHPFDVCITCLFHQDMTSFMDLKVAVCGSNIESRRCYLSIFYSRDETRKCFKW